MRYLESPQPITPLKVALPLRILGMVAIPNDQEALEVEHECQRMQAALTRLETLGLVRLTWVKGQTWHDLQRAMWGGPWHIFHFIGHGGFDPKSQEGVLALAGESGQTHLLRATDVGRLLAGHTDLRLVVLNACEGAKGSTQDVFSSTAATLARKGIPAVVAMQEDITDRAALEWTRAVYEALAHGLPIDAAVAEARTAMSVGISHTLEWGTPVLYLRAPDGLLFEVPPTLTGVSYRERAVPPPASQDQTAINAAPVQPPPPRLPLAPEQTASPPSEPQRHPSPVLGTPPAASTTAPARQRGLPWRALVGAAIAVVLLVGIGVTALLLMQHAPFQQQVTTGTHITTIQVGTGFDATTGAVTGEEAAFQRGERVCIVFTVVAQEAQAQVVVKLFHEGALVATSQPLTPQVGSHSYTNPVEVSQTGPYQVEVDYNSIPEATITFTVSS